MYIWDMHVVELHWGSVLLDLAHIHQDYVGGTDQSYVCPNASEPSPKYIKNYFNLQGYRLNEAQKHDITYNGMYCNSNTLISHIRV